MNVSSQNTTLNSNTDNVGMNPNNNRWRGGESRATELTEEERELINEKNKYYQSYLYLHGDRKLPSANAITPNNNNISFVIRIPKPHELCVKNENKYKKDIELYSEYYEGVQKLIFNEWRCNECKERVKNLGLVLDIETRKIAFCSTKMYRSGLQNYAYNHFKSMWAIIKKHNFNLIIVPIEAGMSNLFNYTIQTGNETQPDWNHYYKQVVNKTNTSETEFKNYESAIERYTQDMMRLMNKFDDRNGLLESLSICYKTVNRVDYASKFKPCIQWLWEATQNVDEAFTSLSLIDKYRVIGEMIISAPICDVENGRKGMLYYHQINSTVMNWLENAYNEISMERLIENTCNPNNYMQKTGRITEKNIEVAKKKLGIFKNTIMSTDILMDRYGPNGYMYNIANGKALALSNTPPVTETNAAGNAGLHPKQQYTTSEPSLNPYDTLLNNINTSNTSRACDFANRCKKSISTTRKFENITMEQLFEYVKTGEVWSLKVNTFGTGGAPAYLVDTTLDSDKLIHNHLWAYINNLSLNDIYMRNSGKVTHMYTWNVKNQITHTMFVLENAKHYLQQKPQAVTNPCLPEFLTPVYNRECGAVFAELGRKQPILKPEDCIDNIYNNDNNETKYDIYTKRRIESQRNNIKWAAGVSTSTVDDYNNLYSGGILLKINDSNSWTRITKQK